MGALCQAQIDGGSSSQPLARGLDAAFAFLRTFVCATPTLHETARAMLQATMAVARRPEARAHVEEMGVAISAAFLPQYMVATLSLAALIAVAIELQG